MKPLLAAASFLFACAAIAGATDQYAPSDLSAPAILAKARAARGTLLPRRYIFIARTLAYKTYIQKLGSAFPI